MSPSAVGHRVEIKLIVMSLIARSTPTLLEGKFEVSDPLNTVRAGPSSTHLIFHWGTSAPALAPLAPLPHSSADYEQLLQAEY